MKDEEKGTQFRERKKILRGERGHGRRGKGRDPQRRGDKEMVQVTEGCVKESKANEK